MINKDNITVIGLGKTGLSTLKYLKSHHPFATIKVIDTRENPAGLSEVDKSIKVHTGSLHQAWMNESDMLIVSPGIDLRQPEFIIAQQNGTKIIGDIEFFAQELKRLNKNPKIIAITGSNGKSTVTTLCYNALKDQNKKVSLGGNIGVPVLDTIDQEVDYYVLELSSFQLETVNSLETVSAAHLNLSPDHLDRYDSMEHYNLAKHKIFNKTNIAIYNADDKATIPHNPNATKISFSAIGKADYYLEHGSPTKLMYNGVELLSEDEIKLVGQHNLTNILATFALLKPLHLDIEKIKDTIKEFAGLDHRCQVVKFENDIKWVNDSKATNLGSLEACLKGLKVKHKLHLLMGGDAKGADLSPLKPLLDKFDYQLYCFGKDKDQIADLQEQSKVFETMQEAIEDLRPTLEKGDMVLLSPACASIDQFKNFEVRGEAFAELANK